MLTEHEISGLACTKVACVKRVCYCNLQASQQISEAVRAHRTRGCRAQLLLACYN